MSIKASINKDIPDFRLRTTLRKLISGSQQRSDLLDALNTVGNVTSDGEFLVGTGSGTFAWESDNTARTSLGLGTGNSPEFTGLTLSGLTEASIPFVGSGGVLSEDNINLTWNDSTKVLTMLGTIDASAGKVLVTDGDISEPTLTEDGEIVVAKISGNPRIYFRVDGTTYYASGEFNIVPETGNPIGLLLTLTYS